MINILWFNFYLLITFITFFFNPVTMHSGLNKECVKSVHSWQTWKFCRKKFPIQTIAYYQRNWFLIVSPSPRQYIVEMSLERFPHFGWSACLFLINCALRHVQLPPVIWTKKAKFEEKKAMWLYCHKRSPCLRRSWGGNRGVICFLQFHGRFRIFMIY